MKTICEKRGWAYKDSDTASRLIATCLKNGLLPTFTESHLNAVRLSLESGVPTIRNKAGGHGQGEAVKDAPEFYAQFTLHQTAVVIVFLVEALKSLP